MSQKSDQKERTHRDILASAARLLRERGVAGARVADVMAGAGLTVGGFYAHFASKEALIDEALRRTARELREGLFSRLEATPSAERAEVVLKRYLSARHRDEPDAGCPFPSITSEIATQHTEHRAVLGEQLEALVTALEPLMPGRGSPARTVAIGMAALMYGGLSLSRALGPGEQSDEVLRACRAFGRLALSLSGANKLRT
jgi:TetR/AcrR family transcriptional repressor of nem operon